MSSTASTPGQPKPESVGLPPRTFLYTLDQIAEMVAIPLPTLRQRYVYFDGHSIGALKRSMLLARNISPDDQADWRVAEAELIRWMKFKRFRFHARGWLQS
jgi:hypothetical protein